MRIQNLNWLIWNEHYMSEFQTYRAQCHKSVAGLYIMVIIKTENLCAVICFGNFI